MTDKALAERLRKLAQAYRSVVVVDVTSINEATDLDRAADLIERMAQAEPVAWAATDESGQAFAESLTTRIVSCGGLISTAKESRFTSGSSRPWIRQLTLARTPNCYESYPTQEREMIDRELLELAAKAAGLYTVGPYESALAGFMGLCIRPDDNPSGYCWNPLDDDGDALRLAVKLDICVNVNTARGTSWTNNLRGDLTAEVLHDDAVGFDPYAATRRAVVRAAAEIGRRMQHE